MKLVNLIPLKEIEEPRKKDMEIFNPIAKEYTDALSKFDTLSQRQKDFSKSYFNAKNEDDKLQALSNLKSNQNNLFFLIVSSLCNRFLLDGFVKFFLSLNSSICFVD